MKVLTLKMIETDKAPVKEMADIKSTSGHKYKARNAFPVKIHA